MKLLFLPDGGYFFDSGKQAYWTHHLDPFLDHLLSAKYPLVEEIYEIALAKNAAFISCRSSDDKLSIHHNLKDASPALAAWLADALHSRTQIHVSIGPDPRTFFAVSNRGFRWGGVDDDFHAHIQGWLRGSSSPSNEEDTEDRDDGEDSSAWKAGYEPESALFAVNGGYLIKCKGGKHLAWNAKLEGKGGYPGLTERLKRKFGKTAKEEKWYDYITLNPYVPDEWAVIWADGSISHNLGSSFKTLFGPVMEYLSSRPGFFDLPLMKPSLSRPASPTLTLPESVSSSVGTASASITATGVSSASTSGVASGTATPQNPPTEGITAAAATTQRPPVKPSHSTPVLPTQHFTAYQSSNPMTASQAPQTQAAQNQSSNASPMYTQSSYTHSVHTQQSHAQPSYTQPTYNQPAPNAQSTYARPTYPQQASSPQTTYAQQSTYNQPSHYSRPSHTQPPSSYTQPSYPQNTTTTHPTSTTQPAYRPTNYSRPQPQFYNHAPTDTSNSQVTQILRVWRGYNKVASQINQFSGSGSGSGSGFDFSGGSSGSGGGGAAGGPFDPSSMINSLTSGTSGGGTGIDPTGGALSGNLGNLFTAGGGSVPPVDPSTFMNMAAGGGMMMGDPTGGMLSGGSCCVM